MSFSINGLVSGLDTTQIISDLMKLERIPYTNLETKKTNLQSEQTVFRSINTKLSALKTAVDDLRLSSAYMLSSAKSTNENAIKATASEGASAGTYNVVVDTIAKNHTLKSGSIAAGTQLKDLTFEVNGNSIDLSGLSENATNNDVLEYVKNQINNNDWGISAAVMTVDDSGNKVLTLSSKKTGLANEIGFGTDAADKAISVTGSGFDALNLSTVQPAQNAKFTVNGISVEKSSNTINDVISGVTFELVKGDNSSSTITIDRDADKVASKVEAFVKAYNEVVTLVRDNLAKPSDKTKMNPLQGDSLLKQISNDLYNVFTQLSGDKQGYQMMSQLGLEIDKGITVGSLMTGKITFDKEVFKTQFAANPTAVSDLFRAQSTGIMNTLDDHIKSWTNTTTGLMTSKIKGYDSEIKVVDDRLVAMDNRLAMKEQQLKSQFNAMEVALTSLKNQQSWLTNQLAALTPSKS